MNSEVWTDTFIAALQKLEQDGGESSVPEIVALFAPDASLTNTALLLGGASQTDIHEFWMQYKKTIGSGKSEFHHRIVGKNSAGLFWKTRVRNGEGEYDGATVLEFNDSGKICLFQGYYDTRQLNHAVGVNDH